MHPGGPRDGWEKQYKKKHWEFNYTNDVSFALSEPIMVTEADETKWKETYTYGAAPKTLWYLTDALGSTLGMVEKDGRMSARYHYDEFGVVLDAKKFDVNWPGPDNLFGYRIRV